MLRLKVKNFGPLKDIDIELKQVNLFIGENGTGKSVLGKLINVLTGIQNDLLIKAEDTNEQQIQKSFNEYRISFLKNNSEIDLIHVDDNEEHFVFQHKNQKSKLLPSPFMKEMMKVKEEWLKTIEEEAIHFFGQTKLKDNPKLKEILLDTKIDLINALTPRPEGYFNLKQLFSKNNIPYSNYLPAERNLTALLTRSIASFLTAELPIPKYLLDFTSLFEKARNEIKTLSFLNFRYEYDGQNDKVYYSDTEFQYLHQSSSGIQAAIPLMIVAKYLSKKAADMIIEEPELNLFPKAQYEITKFLISQIQSIPSKYPQCLYLMTHSPYILTSLNNLIYAYQTAQKNETAKAKVLEHFKESELIDPDQFTAYVLENGTARSIVDPETGLIDAEAIDEVSDLIADQFDHLMEIKWEK